MISQQHPMASITAIATTYRRPETLLVQIRALRAQSEPPRAIWVWANEPDERFTAALGQGIADRVIRSSDNAFFHGRFSLALLAPTEYVAIFDDDTLPGENWFRNCLETMARTPGILGTAGVVLHGPSYHQRTMHGWQRPSADAQEVDLVGQAWFLRTEWVKYLFAERPVTGRNGEDIELGARAWRLARIRSYCAPHPVCDRSRWGSLDGMRLGTDSVAASRKADHEAVRDEIVQAEISAGWQPLCLRNEEATPRRHAGLRGEPFLRTDAAGGDRYAPSGGPARQRTALAAGPRVAEAEVGEDCVEAADAPMGQVPRADLPSGDEQDATGPNDRVAELDAVEPDAEAAGGFFHEELIGLPTPLDDVLIVGGESGEQGEPTRAGRVGTLNADAEGRPSLADLYRSMGARRVTHVADATGIGLLPAAALFDVVDCADSLACVQRPERCLAAARKRLRPGGVVRARFANARQRTVLGALIAGDWRTCHDERVADLQLHVFTRREIEKLFFRAGLFVPELRAVPNPALQHWRRHGGRTVRCGPLQAKNLSPALTEELLTESYQAQATARPAESRSFGRTSIVIVTFNELGFTRPCLASIRAFAASGLEDLAVDGGEPPYEIIVVDNGSTDGTVEFLRAQPDVRLIENRLNRGFPAAANQGIRAAAGEQILLLNNDTLLCTGSLERMLCALHGDEQVGLVGPRSNCVSGEQQTDADYQDWGCLDGFGWTIATSEQGHAMDVSRLVGFCLLIRRAVVDKIGLLDERFGIGNFEDDDYTRRAREAGFRTVIALDSFVHHFGGRSFAGNNIDLGRLLQENQAKYQDKWKDSPAVEGEAQAEASNADESKSDESQADESQAEAATAESREVAPSAADETRADGASINETSAELRAVGPSAAAEVKACSTGKRERDVAATERGTDPASALSDQKPRGTRRLLRPIFLYESAADRTARELARRERAMVAAAADGLSSAALQGGSSAARTVVSLCMIVRDNAATIEACLASIRPFVDEMVVVDTGSLDETPEICRRMGARVFHMTWPESFAAARNESLRHARGEWIFWMDSDDLIDTENGAKLKALAAGPHEPDVLGYSMQVRCPGRDSVGAGDFCLVDHCKLFRNRPDVRFEFRVHEQLLASINRAGARNVFQDLFVVHAMSDESPRTHRFKYRRDLRYLRRELRELPDHPFVLYNLGMTYHFGPKHAKAVRVLERCVARATSEAIYRRAFFLLAGSLIALDKYDEALDACRRGRKLFPHDPELLFREGVVHQHKQDFAAAEQCMLQALQSQEPRYCLSRDMGIMGHKTRHNLALVHEKAGQIDKAIEQWRIILQELPDYQDGWQGLCDCLAIQGRWDEVAEQAARIVAEQPAPKSAGANGSHHGVEAPGPWAAERSLRALGIWQAARALAARGQVQSARQAYRQGLSEHPHDERLWDAWAQFLYEHGPREESLFVSELIARNRPRSSVDQFNLGLTCLNAGQPERAVECCSRALALQPNVAPHEFTLGLAYLHCNRMTEAVAAWQRALAIDPNHGPSRNALDVARREVNACRVPAAGRAPAVELART